MIESLGTRLGEAIYTPDEVWDETRPPQPLSLCIETTISLFIIIAAVFCFPSYSTYTVTVVYLAMIGHMNTMWDVVMGWLP